MDWSTFLTACAQILIAVAVLRFCADLIRGAITGEKSTGSAPSPRDLIARARARLQAQREDEALVTGQQDVVPATEVIPTVPAKAGNGSTRA